jgi:DNA-binding transcriptional LysR family regulator
MFQSHEAITPHGNLQTNSPLALLKAAESGQGIVVLPCFTAAGPIAEGKLVRILKDHPTVRYPIVAIHPHRGLLPTKAVVFIDMVGKHLREVVPCSGAQLDARTIPKSAALRPAAKARTAGKVA